MPFVETLYAKSAEWKTANPLAPLMQIAGQFGMTEGQVRACLGDQKMVDHINAVRTYVQNELHITEVPRFLFNGRPINYGFSTFDEFVDALREFKL